MTRHINIQENVRGMCNTNEVMITTRQYKVTDRSIVITHFLLRGSSTKFDAQSFNFTGIGNFTLHVQVRRQSRIKTFLLVLLDMNHPWRMSLYLKTLLLATALWFPNVYRSIWFQYSVCGLYFRTEQLKLIHTSRSKIDQVCLSNENLTIWIPFVARTIVVAPITITVMVA